MNVQSLSGLNKQSMTDSASYLKAKKEEKRRNRKFWTAIMCLLTTGLVIIVCFLRV